MSGVALRAGFDNSAITTHLAMLAIMEANGFDGTRREIGEYVLGEVQDNLDGQKLADGSAMPQSKAAIARSGKTLIEHHHLYDSYVYQLVAGGVEVGSASVYAAIHHFGGETGRRGHRFSLPARAVLGIGPRQEARIGDYLVNHLRRAQP